MLWSLIYRKLRANRGNTMITIYEAEKMFQLIRNKNNREELDCSSGSLCFNKELEEIDIIHQDFEYIGNKEDIKVLPRLIRKYGLNLAFESHLQAYIIKYIGTNINETLDRCILGQNCSIEWLGNEMSCGVGMQRIDVALSAVRNEQRIFIPIELKSVIVKKDIVYQMQRYIDWIKQYYLPNRQSDIEPIIIGKKRLRRNIESYRETVEAFNNFNESNNLTIKYIEYEVENNNLNFEEVNY